MKTFIWGIALACLLATSITTSSAQFAEDALRLSTPGLGVGARSLGMGAVWTGTANDYSAMYSNPAGLGQIRTNEVSVGLSNYSLDNSSTFLGKSGSMSNSSTSLNNVGFVYPFPTTRGSMVFSAGYVRDADYSGAVAFDGFNPLSSIVPSLDANLAYNLYLTEANGSTPYTDSMQQHGQVLEGGGTNNWTVAGAIEAARNLYVGLSVTFISGSYTYDRAFAEDDIYNKYSVARYGTGYAIRYFDVHNTITSDIGGFTAKMGMVYKPNTQTRIGMSVKLPTYYTIQETFTADGSSTFDAPDSAGNYSYYYTSDGRTEYDVHSPFVFNFGFSYALSNLLLAGDVDYTDWTQMSFANADPYVMAENSRIKKDFRGTANFHVGAEYEFPTAGIRIRGGYAYMPSPYKGDPSDFAKKYITAGVGFIIEDMVAIDLGFAHGSYNTVHSNYDNISVTSEKVTTNNIIGTVSYRF